MGSHVVSTTTDADAIELACKVRVRRQELSPAARALVDTGLPVGPDR